MSKPLSDLERYRALQGYLSHDHRGELGRALSSARLALEMQTDPEVIKELLAIIEMSLTQGLKNLDDNLHLYSPETEFVWVISNDPSVLSQLPKENADYQLVSDLKILDEKRSLYRPDRVVIDCREGEPMARAKQVIEIIGSSLTEYLLLFFPLDDVDKLKSETGVNTISCD